MIAPKSTARKTVVVIGNGMVGHRFCERLVEFDTTGEYRVVTFCEEPRAAYDRVQLSKYFTTRDPESLMIADPGWYRDRGIDLHIGERAEAIDRTRRIVRSNRGREIHYDTLVLATGSVPFVPSVPGIDLPGVFLYRTIEDLEQTIAYARRKISAAIIGGGLLGLEAAKAVLDLGLHAHVVEFAPRLMPRQLDERGSQVLIGHIERMGVSVLLNKTTESILGQDSASGLRFKDGSTLPVELVVVSAGIRPRDELARACGLDVGPRGGVVVNDLLQCSDENIYAIGEVALHRGMIYGLVAPGYEMAESLTATLTGSPREFKGADLSTRLRLMGVDVASFGGVGAESHPSLDRRRTGFPGIVFRDRQRVRPAVAGGAGLGVAIAIREASTPQPGAAWSSRGAASPGRAGAAGGGRWFGVERAPASVGAAGFERRWAMAAACPGAGLERRGPGRGTDRRTRPERAVGTRGAVATTAVG